MGLRRFVTATVAVTTLAVLAGGVLGPAPHAAAQRCEMWGSICVPPEAKRIIDSVPRTPATNNHRVIDALEALVAAGAPRDEVMRVGLGRFPIAGRANYVHDWLYPRFGPGFRFHQGTDVFADHGTPLRSPVDGVATSRNGGLGGLTVRITLPDGTYFYLAHLARLADGFRDGMQVSVGDLIGYVGDSGNARGGAPHLHLGIYPQGGAAIDPKPLLDRWLAEAERRLPMVIEAFQEAYDLDGAPQVAPAPEAEEPPPSPPPPTEEEIAAINAGDDADADAVESGDGDDSGDADEAEPADDAEAEGEVVSAGPAVEPVLFAGGADPVWETLSAVVAELPEVVAEIERTARQVAAASERTVSSDGTGRSPLSSWPGLRWLQRPAA